MTGHLSDKLKMCLALLSTLYQIINSLEYLYLVSSAKHKPTTTAVRYFGDIMEILWNGIIKENFTFGSSNKLRKSFFVFNFLSQ